MGLADKSIVTRQLYSLLLLQKKTATGAPTRGRLAYKIQSHRQLQLSHDPMQQNAVQQKKVTGQTRL